MKITVFSTFESIFTNASKVGHDFVVFVWVCRFENLIDGVEVRLILQLSGCSGILMGRRSPTGWPIARPILDKTIFWNFLSSSNWHCAVKLGFFDTKLFSGLFISATAKSYLNPPLSLRQKFSDLFSSLFQTLRRIFLVKGKKLFGRERLIQNPSIRYS